MILLCSGMFFLIMDPQCALSGAREGLELCIKTVIPSLLPFFFLSVMLTNQLAGKRITALRPLGKKLGIPEGMESVFLTGILGGYPVGAQAVAQVCQTGALDRHAARRMLGFCSNAGPSFIFGILGGVFTSASAPWALWGIHLVSALLVGALLPGREHNAVIIPPTDRISAATALDRTIRILSTVCGWVILFRVVIRFLDRWILWLLPPAVKTVIIGTLELTNGCCLLAGLENEGLRFILASCFLAFGGSCVAMQTLAVTREMGTGWYFPGKAMQTMISFLLAWTYQSTFFPVQARTDLRPVVLCPVMIVLLLTVIYLKKHKNNSSIPALSGV